MALLCWLPLNGNIENNGVGNITISGSQTYDNAGKIGKCLNSNGATTVTISEIADSHTWSVAFWGYVTSSLVTGNWTGILYLSDGGTSLRVEVCPSSYASGVYCYSTHNNSGYKITSGSITDVSGGHYDKWMHFCMTSDGTTIRVYRDGVLAGSSSYDGSGAITGTFSLVNNDKIKKNDFRVYSTCLSPKEVEILARGLVLHYPLSLAQANMLKTTPRSYNAGSYQAYAINLTENMVAGQQYTIQFWDVDISHTGKSSSELGVYVYWGGGMNTECSFSIPSGHADYLVKTFTAQSGGSASDANNLWLNIYNSVPSKSGTMNMKIGHWKMEKGSVATPWIPSSADSDYSSLNTEYDVSGNKYNATITGTVERNSNTARYSTCTGFSNSTYESVSITPGDMTSRFTFAWWARYTLYSAHMFWGFANGNRLNLFMNNTFCWNTGDGANNTFGVSASTYADNNWHHFAVTGDGTTVKLYIDGEFKANAKTFKGVTGTSLVLNGWDSSSSYDFNGYLSDFRLYSTALSATQIAELYNTSASISNNGTLMGYEFVEQ